MSLKARIATIEASLLTQHENHERLADKLADVERRLGLVLDAIRELKAQPASAAPDSAAQLLAPLIAGFTDVLKNSSSSTGSMLGFLEKLWRDQSNLVIRSQAREYGRRGALVSNKNAAEQAAARESAINNIERYRAGCIECAQFLDSVPFADRHSPADVERFHRENKHEEYLRQQQEVISRCDAALRGRKGLRKTDTLKAGTIVPMEADEEEDEEGLPN